MVTSISGVQSTFTCFHECYLGENPHYDIFCNLLPEVRCASDSVRCTRHSVKGNNYFNKKPLDWSSRAVNSRTLWLYRLQARPFKFTALVFNRIKMATERDEAIVSERRDDWGMSDRDRKWVSSAESSLVIDPCHQTAGCYMQVCIQCERCK